MMKRAGRKSKRYLWGLMLFSAFAFIPHARAQTCVSSPAGLVHWWLLDESAGSGTVADITGGILGTVNGATLGVAGKVGTAASFDGVDDFVASDLPDQSFSDYTIELWVKASELGQAELSSVLNNFNNTGIGGGGTPDSLQIDVDGGNPGNYRIFFGGPTVVFGPVNTDWQHLAVTYNGEAVKTYLNGQFTGNSLVLPPDSAGTNFRDLVMGRNRGDGRYFNGLIDEVGIYNRVLTDSEIQAIFNAGSAGKCIPFVSSAAKGEIKLRPGSNNDTFEAKGSFVLGASSDGINPLTEDVSLRVGTFVTTIPAGSFKKDKKGRFKFQGVINDVALKAVIQSLGGGKFKFEVEGKKANLTAILGLTIGDDGGSLGITDGGK